MRTVPRTTTLALPVAEAWQFLLVLTIFAPASALDRPAEHFSHTYDPAWQVESYGLAARLEADFSAVDGMVSAFWRPWLILPEQGVDLESALLPWDASYAAGEPAANADDICVSAWFAYGDVGLYFLFNIHDDDRVGPSSNTVPYLSDAVVLFLDVWPAESLYARPEQRFPCLFDKNSPNELTKSFWYMEVPCGGPELVEQYRIGWWRPDSGGQILTDCHPAFGNDNSVALGETTSFAEAEALLGVKAEILPIEGGWQRQEWLIPWAVLGYPGAPRLTGVPADRRVAFTFGFNDYDRNQSAPTILRWRNGADPFTWDTIPDGLGDRGAVDTWGELVLGRDLDSLVNQVPCGWSPCYPSKDFTQPAAGSAKVLKLTAAPPQDCGADSPVYHVLHSLGPGSTAPARIDRFTILGRKLPGYVSPRSGVLIKRLLSSNGRVRVLRSVGL